MTPGLSRPLGATWDGMGTNFAIFSEHASGVDLCLFDSAEAEHESQRIPIEERDGQIWHCYLPDIRPGQLYGYRVRGPWEPGQGQRFNAAKVLLDPYARAIGRDLTWDASLFAYPVGGDELERDERDSAPFAPLAMVVDPAFTWGNDVRPRTPWEHTFIYEAHVKGLTQLHPEVSEDLRGSYMAIASRPVIDHLLSLGVTAIELMPVHHHVDDQHLVERGLSNYWGYNTLGFFAPNSRYASTGDGRDALQEFKVMVRALHAAGIEVILDVVYNHTAEGNHLGPSLSWRGIDNLSYYRTVDDDPRYYMDFTGTGNTLNLRHHRVLQMVMDSLRYWATEMHVDGFRFDLASTLARELFEVDRLSSFFEIIAQDPVLSDVKLIAEPWDVGPGGYQVGNFPPGWAEWNGEYRDTVRRFWKGDDGQVGSFATRFAGSSDLYETSGRKPYASVNFVTAHDGFTLRDLVSYEQKHNEANGEENRDGHEGNHSWNNGAEGETTDRAVQARRDRDVRNLIATLFLSQGVPMLLAGDEIGRSQQGNNNAYCQDNELSWVHWDLTPAQADLRRFTAAVARFFHEQPVLHRRRFLQGVRPSGAEIRDVTWLLPDGNEIGEDAWNEGWRRSFGVRLSGDAILEPDIHGRPIEGDTLLILFNVRDEPVDFVVPRRRRGARWELAFDTSSARRRRWRGDTYQLDARSLSVLREPRPRR